MAAALAKEAAAGTRLNQDHPAARTQHAVRLAQGRHARGVIECCQQSAHAVHDDDVERAVVERQPLGGVGADERPGVRGTLDDVGAGDVELRLERPQPKRAAADVED
jgi:hypothetical protein